ncbi:SDR family NAD(P)-dependent oxidoreductase [Gammaproteobacteria bacterium]|nr:SDR family NAD(P)-dependent oxidoreductase [Gammaproteobacteria bacterium]
MSTGMERPVVLMTGAVRGVGLAVAAKFSQEGYTVSIFVKDPQSEDSTKIASDLNALGGQVELFACDIRSEEQIVSAVDQVYKTHGRIDACVLNASVINLNNVQDSTLEEYDLMHSVNSRSHLLVSKYAQKYLRFAECPQICVISPPINLDPRWLGAHLPYTSSRYLASMIVVGLAEEMKADNIKVNALWPKTNINSKDVCNVIQGTYEAQKQCRHPAIMGDACWSLINKNAMGLTGEFFIDEEVLRDEGVEDFSKYADSNY